MDVVMQRTSDQQLLHAPDVYQRRLSVQGINTSATSSLSRLSPSNRPALMPSLCHLRSIHSLPFLLPTLFQCHAAQCNSSARDKGHINLENRY